MTQAVGPREAAAEAAGRVGERLRLERTMKVVCDRSALLEAINLMTGVASARSPRPQLTCVKLEASGGEGLTLTASDAEVSLRLNLERVEVEEAGAALVPADKLAQIVRAEDAEPTLTLAAEGDTTHIRTEDAHFQLKGLSPEDFPQIQSLAAFGKGRGGFSVITMTAGTLGEMVRRTLFAAARENSRYAINGVLLKAVKKRVEMVATDGRRLALSRMELEGEGDEVACIVPSKALNLLGKLIDEPGESVRVAVSAGQVVFGFGGGESPRAVLSSALVEGSFPPYEDVIPKDQDIRVTFDREVLASGVRRAALLTSEESRGVRMKFVAADKKLELSSRVAEMGEARVEVGVDSFEGGDIEIGFNPQFITDALKVIDERSVQIELKASNKPGMLRAAGGFVYVVMPVTLT